MKGQTMEIRSSEGEVSINGQVLKSFRYFYDVKDLLKFAYNGEFHEAVLNEVKNEEYLHLNKKYAYNKAKYKLLGGNSNKLLRLVNRLMFKTFLVKYDRELLLKMCFSTRTRSFTRNIHKFTASYDKLLQAKNDNLEHLLPIILKFNKDPKELKEIFGNKCWKELCSNSFSRNKLLVGKSNFNSDIDLIKNSSNIASSLLPYRNRYCTKTLQVITKQYRGTYKNPCEWRTFADTAEDTILMCNRLGVVFNTNWSSRRVKEEHDILFQMELAKQYPKTDFDYCEILSKFAHIQHLNYEAKLLKSPHDLYEEGRFMHHCVAGYSCYCTNGTYIVYSILNTDSGERSTLGLNVVKGSSVALNQHYGKYNASVTDNVAIDFTKSIILKLNTFLKENRIARE